MHKLPKIARAAGMCLFAALMACGLSGCGEEASAPTSDTEASESADSTATTLPDQYMSYGDTGEGEAYIVSTNGSSQAGDMVQLRVAPGFQAAELSVIAHNLACKTPLYVYVDGKLVQKIDDVDHADTTITLENEAVSATEHSVNMVQYQNGNPDSPIVFFRTSRYVVSG